MIACIGWGSLTWDPAGLPISGQWHDDGPQLPIEFVRQSDNGRLTLAINPGSSVVRTYWASLNVNDLEAAIEALRIREGRTRRKWIGDWSHTQLANDERTNVIAQWANEHGIASVVWAALPPKFHGQNGLAPTEREAVAYLLKLTGEERRLAEEYVRRTPSQIRTSYRASIERELGWTPKSA
jgi:hypothetical protein